MSKGGSCMAPRGVLVVGGWREVGWGLQTGAADGFQEWRGTFNPFIFPKDPSKQRWSLGFKGPTSYRDPSDFNSPWRFREGGLSCCLWCLLGLQGAL